MPDPNVLYVVTGVVVLGLIAWVGAVLLRSPLRVASSPTAPAGSARPNAAVEVAKDRDAGKAT